MTEQENILGVWNGPAILLVDLDAFFASVEQLDHPGWRGKPVIVGGDAQARGVVSTASYEARAFGVHSAMPSSQAQRLCPQAIWTQGHFARYKELSCAVMDILRRETPYVQQVSIDEAFLDVTPTRVNTEHPVSIARRIQDRVDELGLSCSVGVGSTKTIAKIASDRDKPHGLTVVFPGSERAFLDPLPVRALSGVGAAAEAKLHAHGIETLGDLARVNPQLLRRLFGKNGQLMHDRAAGKDFSAVVPDKTVKSVSHELSFARDLHDRDDILAAVDAMAAKVARRLRSKGMAGCCINLKLRYGDRSLHTAQCHMEHSTDDEFFMRSYLRRLLEDIWRPGIAVRLVGVAISDFSGEVVIQERLFDDEQTAGESENADGLRGVLALDEAQRRKLLDATDSVRGKFGEDAVSFGRELRNRHNSTGTVAKNPADSAETIGQ